MATVQGVFVALFGRPADPAGLAYLSMVTKGGSDWSGLSVLSAQSEFQARYSGLADKGAVALLYQTVFGRAPEAAGLNYWLSQLQSGHYDRTTLAVAMLDGAQGSDLSTANSKLAAADLFTVSLDLPLEQQSYAGSSAALVGRNLLSGVTAAKQPSAATIDEIILELSQNEGQKPFDGEKVVLVFTSSDLVKLSAEPTKGSMILKAATINNIEFNTWGISGQDAAAFSIDRNTGAISLQKSGYLSDKQVASFTITATDAAGNTGSQVVTIALAGQTSKSPLMEFLSHEPSASDLTWPSASYSEIAVETVGLTTMQPDLLSP